jgi:membrane protease YdiL (CAAX protease family)
MANRPPDTVREPTSVPPEPPAEDRPDVPPWRIWTAPAAVALGLGIGVFATLVVQLIGHAGGSSLAHPTPAVNIVSDVVFDGSFVVAALYFAGMGGRPRPWDFGFRRVRLGLALAACVLAAVAYYVATAVYASLLHLSGSDKLPSELGAGRSTAALVATAAFVCVVAPIAEEFFFRGFFFGALRQMRIVLVGRNVGTWVAAIITGILFGLAHTGSASSQFLIPLGFLGFVLCLVRWRTGSLYPCIALHSFNNALALGVDQHWSALEVVGLMLGSWLLVAALTGPLVARGATLTVQGEPPTKGFSRGARH